MSWPSVSLAATRDLYLTAADINGLIQSVKGQPKQRSLEVRRGGKNRGYVKANLGKFIDRGTGLVGAAADINEIVQSVKGQPKQRSLDVDLEERAFEDYIMERYYS